ncbi:hypothetical protein DENSPDRAFT_842959 [Dentipellis sp. KUC8613]|nr:hypothetical protein DENSPDRAFT_842959 [Dentipellis sp. KUC8613]
MIPVDDVNLCNYCHVDSGRADLRQCSGCKSRRYCSKECQRKAWPAHKNGCQASSKFREEMLVDSELAARNSTLSRWISKWQPVIVNAAVDALNLPNNSAEDYLVTHSVFIEIGKRPDPPNRSAGMAYKVLRGCVMTNDEWIQEMISRGASDEHVEGWGREDRGPDVARIIIHCGDLLRFLYLSLGATRETRRHEDRLAAHLLNLCWYEVLCREIHSGEFLRGR